MRQHNSPEAKRLILIVAITGALTAGCLGVAAYLSHDALQSAGTPPSEKGAVFVHRIRDNDAGVRQRPILRDHPAYQQRQAQRDHLTSTGWVDERRGRAHIPIDVAMDLIVAKRNPPKAAQQVPP